MPDNNALHDAAKDGNVAEVRSQVGKFDINAKGEYDGTALYWAAREGKTEVVKLLLTLNPAPDVNLPDVSIPTIVCPSDDMYFHILFMFYTHLLPTPLRMCCYHA